MTRIHYAIIGVLAAVLAATLVARCDPKKPTPPRIQKDGAPAKDAELAALAPLEMQPDLAHCRTALQQLDNLDSAQSRPVLSESERGDVAAFLGLTLAEVAEIAHGTFSQSDAA